MWLPTKETRSKLLLPQNLPPTSFGIVYLQQVSIAHSSRAIKRKP